MFGDYTINSYKVNKHSVCIMRLCLSFYYQKISIHFAFQIIAANIVNKVITNIPLLQNFMHICKFIHSNIKNITFVSLFTKKNF